MILNDDERRDVQFALQSAIHALTYPMVRDPEHVRVVDQLRAAYDVTLSDEQRTRRTAMLDRLHEARASA
jgi:hypothetical protein